MGEFSWLAIGSALSGVIKLLSIFIIYLVDLYTSGYTVFAIHTRTLASDTHYNLTNILNVLCWDKINVYETLSQTVVHYIL